MRSADILEIATLGAMNSHDSRFEDQLRSVSLKGSAEASLPKHQDPPPCPNRRAEWKPHQHSAYLHRSSGCVHDFLAVQRVAQQNRTKRFGTKRSNSKQSRN